MDPLPPALAAHPWAPFGWFAPVVAGLTLLALALVVRGWRRPGLLLGVILPWLMATAALALAVMCWHLDDQALLLDFSQYGRAPPPWARYYLYVGAMGVLPMIGIVVGPLLRRRVRQTS